MAGMRPPTLMLRADGAYCTFAVAPDAYPPRITGEQLVPLWKMLPAPTPANTKPGPFRGPVFSRQPASSKSRDVVGKIRDLRVVDRREHRGHDAVIAMADVVPVFAQRLDEKVLALIRDAGHVFAPGQIEVVTTVAAMLGDQRAAGLHTGRIRCVLRRRRRG